ncbi:MAG: ATP-binding protein [Firmicutes bacterium]|nr:ATP-binding protein [Bacillota bacterium]
MQKRYPFKFLDAYTREDAPFYFGRDEEVTKLYEMVSQTDLLLVYGASGTGKTSLIQCGLASKFFIHDWLPIFVRRGRNINDSLKQELMDKGAQYADTEPELAWLDQDLSPLEKQFKDIYLRHFQPIYLIFDQFEELYILGTEEEQHAFFETIKEILRLDQHVKIIISIREEYLGYLYDFEQEVPELLRKKLRIEPMTFNKVKEVIKGVAESKSSNVSLAKSEGEAIITEIFKKIKGNDRRISIELPYLQVFLDKLYLSCTRDETRKVEAIFTLSKLNEIGDIGDVLRDLLDEQVTIIADENNLSPDNIWKILSPFVTLDGTKEPLSFEDLIKKFPDIKATKLRKILETFVTKRILRIIEIENKELYEVRHDSLAKQIHAKRSDEEIALLEVQRLIRTQVSLKDENREYFTEKQLLFMDPFLRQCHLSEKEEEWIEKSKEYIETKKKEEQEKQKRELKQAKKRARIWVMLSVISFLLLGFALMMSGLVYNKQKEAEENAARANISLEKYKEAKIKRIETEIINILPRIRTIMDVKDGDISDVVNEIKEIMENNEVDISVIEKIISENENNEDIKSSILNKLEIHSK